MVKKNTELEGIIHAAAINEFEKQKKEVLKKVRAVTGLNDVQLQVLAQTIKTPDDLENIKDWVEVLRRKDKVATLDNLAPKKFVGIAEKIVEGLLQSEFCEDQYRIGYIGFPHKPMKKEKFVEAIAKAIKSNLTYGNLSTLTLRNNLGEIVAKLYVLPDGTLADDSWLCNKGWK